MKAVEQLKDLIKTQSSHGNYDCNPYMWGLANGLILALSLFDGVSPVFLERPAKFLDDEPVDDATEKH